MDLSSILFALGIVLGAAAVCVVLFTRLGFGSVLGFIIAGILVGPHTPGPVASDQTQYLQTIAEFGVVLFLFTVGLEMRPAKIWSMRRLLFGLGSSQVLITAAAIAVYFYLVANHHWQNAVIVGLASSMSSTAIIMATLGERGELASKHGQASFSVLMAQDLWIVPVMALVPILGHQVVQVDAMPGWEKALLVVATIAGVIVVGRYVLPPLLEYCAAQRRMDAFGIVLFLAVIAASWGVDQVGISMTLGAFLMGIMLSASDYRYQIEAIVSPFKSTLMALFFIAVGMSIDVGAFLEDWPTLLVHIPVVIGIKVVVLTALAVAFGIGREAAIRTGFYLSQVGELAFVLLGTATIAGLLSPHGQTLGMLTISATMIVTPLMVKLGDWLATSLQSSTQLHVEVADSDMKDHVVVVGYDEIGQLICLMLHRANIPFIACDHDMQQVQKGKQLGHNVIFGEMYSPFTQQAVKLHDAKASYISMRDTGSGKALAITLHTFYPQLNIYLRVPSLDDQDEMVAQGIKHATTSYIESTLAKGGQLLMDVGVSEIDVNELTASIRQDNYALIRA